MKNLIFIFSMLLLIGFHRVSGQFHVHLNNNDSKTRGKLGTKTATIVTRNILLEQINEKLSKALESHKKQLQLQYTGNRFDKGNSLISKLGPAALSLGASALTLVDRLPYMTEDKKNYINSVTSDYLLLTALANSNKTKIKSAKRQEIYRMRDKLIREFSKNDRDARQLFFMTAAGLVVMNFADYKKLFGEIQAVDIAL